MWPSQSGIRSARCTSTGRLARAADITRALAAIRAAGGKVREHGEFIPGEPYVFFKDPDGYDVEIWYELPTPVDPPRTRRR
jgi:predicted enzyme related to lactoylglutathione lyase